MTLSTDAPSLSTTAAEPPVVQTKRRPSVMQYAFGFSARALSALAPGLAARWLDHIFITPQKYPQPERERQWMKNAEVWTLPFDTERSLPLYGWGQGPTVLLVHGLSGRASQMAAFVEPLLAKGFRVVTFDAPAHGNADGKQTALPEVASAVVKVAEHLGPLAGILAHSNGAAATTLALSQGIQAKQVVYVSPPEDLSGYLQRLARFIGFSAAVARRTQARLEQRSGMNFQSVRGSALGPKMTLPALILHDETDRMVPYEEGRKLAEAWPDAKLQTTHGLGHSRILRDPAVIRMATDFLHQNQ